MWGLLESCPQAALTNIGYNLLIFRRASFSHPTRTLVNWFSGTDNPALESFFSVWTLSQWRKKSKGFVKPEQ
jgi:hypothetical protein